MSPMKIVVGFPPNWKAIVAVFPRARHSGVIVAYGDKIYNPTARKLMLGEPEHEAVHGTRQEAAGVEKWWVEYLRDPCFRRHEEVLGYRAEYQQLVALMPENQPRHLQHVAGRLSGQLYNRMMTLQQAVDALMGE